FPERLESLGVSWKCYQNEVAIDTGFQGEEDPWLSNFQDNPLEFFAQYNIHLYPPHVEFVKKEKDRLQKHIADLQQKIAAAPAGNADAAHWQKNLKERQDQLEAILKHPTIAT